MITINILVSLLLLTAVFIYRYIFPRGKISLLKLLILLLIPPIISIGRLGIYESGDFTIHIYRSIEFYRSLSEGNLFPSWAGDLNATYGYPLFIFNYTLPYYILSLFHLIGFSFVASLKLFLAANFLVSGIFMYLAAKKLFNNDLAAFTTAILYQFAPYHLVDVHFGVAVGEIMVFTLLPVTFLLLQTLLRDRNIPIFSLSSIAVSFLIMSHVLLAALLLGIIAVYFSVIALISKNKKIFFLPLSAMILGTIATVYIWLGPSLMTKYTIMVKMIPGAMTANMHISDLLYSPWRFGFLYQGPRGEINTPLGYIHILAVFAAVAILVRNNSRIKKYRIPLLLWVTFFLILLFLVSPLSGVVWEHIRMPILTSIIHRLILIISFITSILAGYVALYFKKEKLLICFILGITMYMTILNWGQRRVIPSMGDPFLIENVPKSTYEVEGHWYANSKWRNPKDPWFRAIPKSHIDILEGTAEVKQTKRLSTSHEYVMYAKTDLLVRENTLYFPGWKVYDNSSMVTAGPDRNGVIGFRLSKGLHFLRVEYSDILTLYILKVITYITFLGMFLTTLVLFFMKFRKKKAK